jgi:hypothetical protein
MILDILEWFLVVANGETTYNRSLNAVINSWLITGPFCCRAKMKKKLKLDGKVGSNNIFS